jgi:DNA-binding transcriptional ArsR family regulator
MLVAAYCCIVTAWTALSDAHRRAALELLRERPRPVGELVAALGLPQPAVSKHLRVLREAGLVTVRRDAQKRIYAVDPQPLAELHEWLARYRVLWDGRLDDLERRLDELEGDA